MRCIKFYILVSLEKYTFFLRIELTDVIVEPSTRARATGFILFTQSTFTRIENHTEKISFAGEAYEKL